MAEALDLEDGEDRVKSEEEKKKQQNSHLKPYLHTHIAFVFPVFAVSLIHVYDVRINLV